MASPSLVSIRFVDLTADPGKPQLTSLEEERMEVLAAVLDELQACGNDEERAGACVDLLVHVAQSMVVEQATAGAPVRPTGPKGAVALAAARRTARRYRR